MLNAAGVPAPAIRRMMPQLVTKAQWIYARRCPADLRDKVCPGVPPLLAALRHSRVPAGLVTGNLTRIAWKKMERAGLKPYFRFGAFAELGATRSQLVRLALRHARAQGWLSQRTTVSLIGDHPNDIRAAKDNRVRAIAVATGLSPLEELAAHQPDLLLRDLTTLDVSMLQQ
jgi:phosphoglycolate phosphatase-like HAD superfamily hydrolase